MLDLSEQALKERFVKNLEFFQTHLPKLHALLLAPPSAYNLLNSPQGFNILHLESGDLLFPYEDGRHKMLEISQEWARGIWHNAKWQLKGNGVELGHFDLENLPLTHKACQEIFQTGSGQDVWDFGENFYPPSAIFGLAGGLFLALLLEEGAFFHALYIFEEHPNLLRLSAYFLDYAKLFKATPPKGCVLFLKTLSEPLLHRIFSTKKITHSFLHLEFKPYMSPASARALESFNAQKSSALRGWGSFEDEMLGLKNTFKNLKKSPLVLNPKTCTRVDVPICVVGNGPSLDTLLDFLQANQDRMIIFSCGTALKPLKARQIAIDFQIEIERIDYLKDVLLQAPLDHTPLLYANMCNPGAVSLAQESYMFMRGGSASGYTLKEWAIEYSAPFVGNAGVSLACLFSKTLILCGLDCGYIEGKSKHAKGSYYGHEGVEIPQGALAIPSNFGDRVFADGLFILSRDQMSLAFKHHKSEVYNLSSGALIANTRPTRPKDLQLPPINKARALTRLKTAFQPAPQVQINSKAYVSFRAQILKIFQQPLHTKRDLYQVVDQLSTLSMDLSAQDPLMGILFEGSLAHICQHLLARGLLLQQAELPAFYAHAQNIILDTLELMRASMLQET
ncbi:6-hydroxymethylpterin diphosphokinase MptE-like protein [Helicobacter felis]|uniref:6-hydroxymethylpterin diphosphokinase MptE-like protein n=1 Tax=Helicobacter felis TaxID=214 RepID=UPI000CF19ED0|nr:6-hydroxymethylpterin diphosphokinase MptE-like protein [Helicobacter felis]